MKRGIEIDRESERWRKRMKEKWRMARKERKEIKERKGDENRIKICEIIKILHVKI